MRPYFASIDQLVRQMVFSWNEIMNPAWILYGHTMYKKYHFWTWIGKIRVLATFKRIRAIVRSPTATASIAAFLYYQTRSKQPLSQYDRLYFSNRHITSVFTFVLVIFTVLSIAFYYCWWIFIIIPGDLTVWYIIGKKEDLL